MVRLQSVFSLSGQAQSLSLFEWRSNHNNEHARWKFDTYELCARGSTVWSGIWSVSVANGSVCALADFMIFLMPRAQTHIVFD